MPDTAEPLAIGGGQEGNLSHVTLWNRGLSAADVANLYGATGRPVAATAPQAPRWVSATAGAGSVSASWAAPAYTGLSPITSYRATASPGGASCTTASAPCTITGLTPGVAYTVTVTATNAVGTGPESTATSPATPW